MCIVPDHYWIVQTPTLFMVEHSLDLVSADTGGDVLLDRCRTATS